MLKSVFLCTYHCVLTKNGIFVIFFFFKEIPIDLGSLQILNLIGSIYWLNWEFRYPDGLFENWANELRESHLFPNPYVLFCVFECRNWRWLAAAT